MRVNDLRALGVLDSEPEPQFDHLTALVREIFDAPIALVSLVDETRQWFKSASGLSERQTGRDISFCAHAIADDELLVIPDALLDPRFADNPFVRSSPNIRFYAGAVLRGPQCYPVGTLCILDTRARTFGLAARARLRAFASLAEHLLHESYRYARVARTVRAKSLYDPLTQLPEAALIQDRLEHELLRIRRTGHYLIVVYIDIKGFRHLNETLGREAGNHVLKVFGVRLREHFSSATVGRWNNDRFVVILPSAERAIDMMEQVHDVVTLLEQPIQIMAQAYYPKIRLGVSVAPSHGDVATTLIDRAALVARQPGEHSPMALYSSSAAQQASRPLQLEIQLRAAIRDETLSIVFQPKVDMDTGRVIGAEALARWNDAILGAVSPAEFVPLAEQRGLSGLLGEWVLSQVLRCLHAWEVAGAALVPVSINVSGHELKTDHFAKRFAAFRAKNTLTRWLEFEITESAFVTDPAIAATEMSRVRALGARWALDDFGTGYSSLNYLRSLPLDVVKLDRSFVVGASQSGRDRALLRSIIRMVADLGLTTIAEGVETDGQRDMLLEMGCRVGQGFLFSRPMNADEFARHLALPKGPV